MNVYFFQSNDGRGACDCRPLNGGLFTPCRKSYACVVVIEFLAFLLSSFCPKFALIVLFCLEKRPSSPFMIDLPRLKAVGTGLAFGYDRHGL